MSQRSKERCVCQIPTVVLLVVSAGFNAVSDPFVDVGTASAFEVSFTNDGFLAPLGVQLAWGLGVLRLHKRQRIVAETAENLQGLRQSSNTPEVNTPMLPGPS